MAISIILLIVGIVGMLFSSVATIHKTTAGAMGRTALNLLVRIVSILLLIVAGIGILGSLLS